MNSKKTRCTTRMVLVLQTLTIGAFGLQEFDRERQMQIFGNIGAEGMWGTKGWS